MVGCSVEVDLYVDATLVMGLGMGCVDDGVEDDGVLTIIFLLASRTRRLGNSVNVRQCTRSRMFGVTSWRIVPTCLWN